VLLRVCLPLPRAAYACLCEVVYYTCVAWVCCASVLRGFACSVLAVLYVIGACWGNLVSGRKKTSFDTCITHKACPKAVASLPPKRKTNTFRKNLQPNSNKNLESKYFLTITIFLEGKESKRKEKNIYYINKKIQKKKSNFREVRIRKFSMTKLRSHLM
jgi:hypothetical protein